MSMNEEAVKQIQSTALAASERQQLEAPENTLVLHKDFTLQDLQTFAATRRRFRGNYQTNDIGDFIRYVKTNAESSRALAFINPDGMSCQAIFNIGNAEVPGHCDWTATLELAPTAAGSALVQVNGKKASQLELTNWIEDWADFLTPYTGNVNDRGSYGTVGRAVDAIRKITIATASERESNVGDFHAARTAIEEIEARSKVGLPAGFTFNAVPYLGLPSREFVLRMQVLTGEDTPRLVLRIVREEQVAEEIVQDFRSRLLNELDGHIDLFIGGFRA